MHFLKNNDFTLMYNWLIFLNRLKWGKDFSIKNTNLYLRTLSLNSDNSTEIEFLRLSYPLFLISKFFLFSHISRKKGELCDCILKFKTSQRQNLAVRTNLKIYHIRFEERITNASYIWVCKQKSELRVRKNFNFSTFLFEAHREFLQHHRTVARWFSLRRFVIHGPRCAAAADAMLELSWESRVIFSNAKCIPRSLRRRTASIPNNQIKYDTDGYLLICSELRRCCCCYR